MKKFWWKPGQEKWLYPTKSIDRSIDRSIIKLIQFRVCKLIKNYVTMMINENNALFFNLNLCVKKNGVKMLLVTTWMLFNSWNHWLIEWLIDWLIDWSMDESKYSRNMDEIRIFIFLLLISWIQERRKKTLLILCIKNSKNKNKTHTHTINLTWCQTKIAWLILNIDLMNGMNEMKKSSFSSTFTIQWRIHKYTMISSLCVFFFFKKGKKLRGETEYFVVFFGNRHRKEKTKITFG